MAVIALCFAIVLMCRKSAISRFDSNCLAFAMLFTLLADVFLVPIFIPVLGVAFFCVVQVLYCARYATARRHLRILPAAVLPGVAAFIFTRDALITIAAVYAALFLMSITFCVMMFAKKRYSAPNRHLMLAGMLLFMLCDICVAIFNSHMILDNVSPALIDGARSAIWLFYVPGQVFLSISGYRFKRAT